MPAKNNHSNAVVNSKPRRSIVGFFWEMLAPFWGYILGFLSVTFIWALGTNLEHYFMKMVLDRLANAQASDIMLRALPPVIYGFITVALLSITWRFYDWLTIFFESNLKKHIILSLFNRLLKHSFSFHQNHFSGNLANKVSEVAASVHAAVHILTDRVVACILVLAFSLYNVSLVHKAFALGMLCWVMLSFGMALVMIFFFQRLLMEASESRSVVVGHLVDILSNVVSVRFFANFKFENRFLTKWVDFAVSKEQSRDRLFFWINMYQGAAFLIWEGVSSWWLLQGLAAGNFTVGDFVLILNMNTFLVDFFWSLAKDVRQFWVEIGNIRQGLVVLDVPLQIVDKPDAKPLVVTQGKIEFDKVVFCYPEYNKIFNGQSVVIHAKQKVGLVGHSGCGKSTFVNLILRLFEINGGKICIDGQDISMVTQESLRQAIAIIPQEPSLFHRSLLENIRYGNINATDEQVMEAAKQAHAEDFIKAMPEGYNAMVGERGVKLSGGQRQRVAIARAVLKNGPILILDEATSQLDSITENHIQDSLWDLMQNKTTLVIAHRLSTLLYMDRILVFDHGKIVQDGTHQELLAQDGIYKELWDAQVGGFLPGTDEVKDELEELAEDYNEEESEG